MRPCDSNRAHPAQADEDHARTRIAECGDGLAPIGFGGVGAPLLARDLGGVRAQFRTTLASDDATLERRERTMSHGRQFATPDFRSQIGGSPISRERASLPGTYSNPRGAFMPSTPTAEDLRKLQQSLFDAIVKKDRAALERLADDGLTYTHSTGRVESKKSSSTSRSPGVHEI